MTHYSASSTDVRVDFFKPSGKWYVTESIKWIGEWHGKKQSIHEAFAQSLRNHFKNMPNRLIEMDAICINPYHEYTHPIQIKAGKWNN